MPLMKFVVEIPPRPKKRPRVYRWSTVNPSEEDEDLFARRFRELDNCPDTPFAGQIRVQFKFYRSPPKSTPQWKLPLMDSGHIRPNKSPDLDNYVKLALDSLNGVLWEDDRYIVEMHSAKYYTTGKPRIEIAMEQVDPPQYKDQAHLIVSDYDEVESLETFFDMIDPLSDEKE